MGDGFKAFWLGVFIVITMAVAAWLLLFLRPTVGDCGHVLKIRFSNIQNVAIGTRVTFGGKPVGEVIKINEIVDARSYPSDAAGNYYFYELELCVDSRVKVFNYDEISFSTSGLLGEKSIAILPKAAPPGMPPAHEVTDSILYARSTDDLQEALAKLSDVAEVFENAMERFNEFLDENMEAFHTTVVAIGQAASSFDSLMNQAIDHQLIEKVSRAAENLATTMGTADHLLKEVDNSGFISTLEKITRGEGALGRLINSDHFYLQLTAVMCKLETTLTDISNYGLLFQYDRKWQRKRLCKEQAMQQLAGPQQAICFFNQQVADIAHNLDRVERLLCRLGPDTQPCFEEGFRELMSRVEHLMDQLKNYRELLFNEYCEACY